MMQIGSTKEFSSFGIAPDILSVLTKHSFTTPTPIQAQSIPVALEGKDLLGIAQTGTGKTLAFGVPMIQFVLQNKGTGLVVLPTRELALQVTESLRVIGGPLGVTFAVLIGGLPIYRQVSEIRRNPHIILGTPGRIIDHLKQKTLNLSTTRVLVLDEADRMLDMGFAPQLKQILNHVPKERQTMLFSATMPPDIVKMTRSFMKLPVQIEIAPPGTGAANVTHEVFIVPREQKRALLHKLLNEYHGSILVFTKTKFAAKKVSRDIRGINHTSAEIHSSRSLAQRRAALQGFKNGSYRVLVATDIAARGIDVVGIELVVNYDLPMRAEDYVHRIGRTGRAGALGHAISFATPDQRSDLKLIERLLRTTLPMSKLPESLPQPPLVPIGQLSNQRVFQRRPHFPRGRSSFRRHGGGHSRGGPHRPG